jgi:hypothetical protein
MRLFRSKEYAFHTDLSVEECIERLRQSIIEEKGYWDSKKSTHFIGKITGNKFRLIEGPRPRSFSSLNFKPGSSIYHYFHGEFISEGDGTRINGYFGLGSNWVVVIVVCIFLFLLAAVSLIPSSKYQFPLPSILVIIVGFLCLAIMLSGNKFLEADIFKLFETELQAVPLFEIKPPHNSANDDSDFPKGTL